MPAFSHTWAISTYGSTSRSVSSYRAPRNRSWFSDTEFSDTNQPPRPWFVGTGLLGLLRASAGVGRGLHRTAAIAQTHASTARPSSVQAGRASAGAPGRL